MLVDSFHYVAGDLHVEHVSMASLAEQFGTPLYIYSRAELVNAYQAYANACAGRNARIYYAVKANSNLAVLDLFSQLGAGFDTVSAGELARVLAAGGRADKVVFSGIGKSVQEMQVALQAGVKCFNLESLAELHRLQEVARALNKRAPVAVRVNPDVDAKTHPYISTGLKSNKFGIDFEQAREVYRLAASMDSLEVIGMACHLGSQMTEIAPYLDALNKMLDLIEVLEEDGISIQHIDVGGGLGIRYQAETPPAVEVFVSTILDEIEKRGHGRRTVMFEPGRSLVGNAGVLLTRIEYLKPGPVKNFAIVDAAMNDLARPTLYQAYHDIVAVKPHDVVPMQYDVVGPVCESGDWLGKDRMLAVAPGDLLAIRSAGAYGFTMSSNYNTRTRAAEVMVDGDKAYLIRERETLAQLLANERRLPLA